MLDRKKQTIFSLFGAIFKWPCLLSFGFLFFHFNIYAGDFSADIKKVENHMDSLLNNRTPPSIFKQKLRSDGLTELYLDGDEYSGLDGNKKTRIFALYGYPQKPLTGKNIKFGKAPAMVLVHGGGGTAYGEWVKNWNKAGFAAISIAVEGQTDIRATGNKHLPWLRHDYAGPSRNGIYQDFSQPISDQWMFHAVSAVIRANNFLRSKGEIDNSHIGLSGISWGGVITATAIGYDPRFDFAIPVYGCGYLAQMDNQYEVALANNPQYQAVWEPGNRLERFNRPTFWLTDLHDQHFSLDAQAKSYRHVAGESSVTIKPLMRHSHPQGWEQPESYIYAQSVVLNGKAPIQPSSPLLSSGQFAQVRFKISDRVIKPQDIHQATIYYTTDTGNTGKAEWQSDDAKIQWFDAKQSMVEVEYSKLPENVVHWFVNLSVKIPADRVLQDENTDFTVSSYLHSTPVL
ncbi:alpha/beta hydrolase family protein [Alteromonas sp. 14N.309.X.WAT.G.H12]|uniref:alpha/beta hydrolase family protein n=1 Tax=Alteromonas sp. 14N.309.X.WAT.G.H12 TaxID=3120824 RepID=UPI002FD2F875